ncbi:DUF6064 family protein [Nostoc sp. CCY0012]|uniref:DUF6064 family protein n=1 Tax=Nostoc sp. CCY0012 TaxID=1056123 RepID=UPI0039C66241
MYPLIGYALGRIFPTSPTFGVPCPTTIFTVCDRSPPIRVNVATVCTLRRWRLDGKARIKRS